MPLPHPDAPRNKRIHFPSIPTITFISHPNAQARLSGVMRLSGVVGISSGLVAGALCRGVALSDGSQSSTNGLREKAAGPISRPLRAMRVLAAEEPLASRRPVVVCGPSGVGKGTLLGKLLVFTPRTPPSIPNSSFLGIMTQALAALTAHHPALSLSF